MPSRDSINVQILCVDENSSEIKAELQGSTTTGAEIFLLTVKLRQPFVVLVTFLPGFALKDADCVVTEVAFKDDAATISHIISRSRFQLQDDSTLSKALSVKHTTRCIEVVTIGQRVKSLLSFNDVQPLKALQVRIFRGKAKSRTSEEILKPTPGSDDVYLWLFRYQLAPDTVIVEATTQRQDNATSDKKRTREETDEPDDDSIAVQLSSKRPRALISQPFARSRIVTTASITSSSVKDVAFHCAFPHGAERIPTSSEDWQCGLFAVINSIKAIHPSLDQPTVGDLRSIVESDEFLSRNLEAADGVDVGLFKEGNLIKGNLVVDQVCLVLSTWGLEHSPPYSLDLGVVIEGSGTVLIRGRSDEKATIVWIYNDNVARPGEDIMNHYEGLRPAQVEREYDSGERL